jgi:hypothetical protein
VNTAPGGHLIDGEVTAGEAEAKRIRMLTVAGSEIDGAIAASIGKTFTALVLFALNPKALMEAAQTSHGQSVDVTDALELILYGEHEVS